VRIDQHYSFRGRRGYRQNAPTEDAQTPGS
jgi:hypothetical protein